MFTTRISYLDAAQDAARWIRAVAQPATHGLTWLPEPDKPEKAATVTAPATIYSGNAGIVLFFLELARATGDRSYRDEAIRGADQIAATWRDVLEYPFFPVIENVNLDFNHGLSGTAFTLIQVWQETGETRYRDAARAIVQHIAAAARPVGAGVEWVGAASAGLGDGAIIFFLLWAARALDDPSLRELARRGGQRILELAEPDPRGGLKWLGFPLERIGAPAGAYMPNFEFGTAGVALVLARLFAETGDPAFLAAAQEGERHIEAIATVRGDAALLFHREPDMMDLYYLGYCGGPVGTARLFYELYRITGEGTYYIWLDRFARGVMTSGVPEKQTPGMWNVVCQCCGTAGILDFFVSLWAATREPEYLTFAERVADVIVSRATDLDGAGDRWYQAWTRTTPWDVTAETGYMIGAAGVGSALLHLHLAQEGRYDAILFPDNPFPPRIETESSI
jgi:Lanthionine synthetase C-like protein